MDHALRHSMKNCGPAPETNHLVSAEVSHSSFSSRDSLQFSLGSAHRSLCRNKFSHSGLRVADQKTLHWMVILTKLTGGGQPFYPGPRQEHPRSHTFKYPSSEPLSLSGKELSLIMQSVLGLAEWIQKVVLG